MYLNWWYDSSVGLTPSSPNFIGHLLTLHHCLPRGRIASVREWSDRGGPQVKVITVEGKVGRGTERGVWEGWHMEKLLHYRKHYRNRDCIWMWVEVTIQPSVECSFSFSLLLVVFLLWLLDFLGVFCWYVVFTQFIYTMPVFFLI